MRSTRRQVAVNCREIKGAEVDMTDLVAFKPQQASASLCSPAATAGGYIETALRETQSGYHTLPYCNRIRSVQAPATLWEDEGC